jgi:hypothetical protein
MLLLLAVLHASAGQVLCLCHHDQPALKPLHTSPQCSVDACGQKPLSESCVDLVVPILTFRSERAANPLHDVLTSAFETITIASQPWAPMGVNIVDYHGDHHPPDLQRYCSLRSTILNI